MSSSKNLPVSTTATPPATDARRGESPLDLRPDPLAAGDAPASLSSVSVSPSWNPPAPTLPRKPVAPPASARSAAAPPSCDPPALSSSSSERRPLALARGGRAPAWRCRLPTWAPRSRCEVPLPLTSSLSLASVSSSSLWPTLGLDRLRCCASDLRWPAPTELRSSSSSSACGDRRPPREDRGWRLLRPRLLLSPPRPPRARLLAGGDCEESGESSRSLPRPPRRLGGGLVSDKSDDMFGTASAARDVSAGAGVGRRSATDGAAWYAVAIHLRTKRGRPRKSAPHPRPRLPHGCSAVHCPSAQVKTGCCTWRDDGP